MHSSVEKLLREADAGVDGRTNRHGVEFVYIQGGDAAISLWHQLREVAEQSKTWPILCGKAAPPDEQGDLPPADLLLPHVPEGSPIQALKAAEAEDWREMGLEGPPDDDDDEEYTALPDFDTWSDSSELPSSPSRGAYDYRNRPLDPCLLALIPTHDPAEAAAYLSFGGFNDCPGPELQVAFQRDWNKRFGAVPITMTEDVLELYLPDPVRDPHVAWEVALEQFAFCPDIVTQGTESVASLAREIWRNQTWFFWWD